MTLLLGVTWVPATLLLVVKILFSGSLRFFLDNLFLFPAITLFSLIQVLAVASAMLALSSLSRSSRYVGMLYAALIFFSQAMYGLINGITRDSSLAWIAVGFDLAQLGDAIFRLPPRFAMPVPVAALVILLVILGSALVLRRRVQGVEVVG